MSTLTFKGGEHVIELIDSNGKKIGSWSAYNNIDSSFAKAHYGSARHLANGSYSTIDKTKPHAHKADANGSFGLHGIIRFNYPGHPGVGVHSGRAAAGYMPGPKHATHGCIRTTDAAMAAIAALMEHDSLTTIVVSGNTSANTFRGKNKHHIHHRDIKSFSEISDQGKVLFA